MVSRYRVGMTTRVLLGVAVVLLIVGLGFGLNGVTAGPNIVDPTECGSVLMPDGDESDERDSINYYKGDDDSQNADACADARSERKPVTYGALGLAAVAGMLALVAAKRD